MKKDFDSVRNALSALGEDHLELYGESNAALDAVEARIEALETELKSLRQVPVVVTPVLEPYTTATEDPVRVSVKIPKSLQ